jgi:AraC-like DNA-binding protein
MRFIRWSASHRTLHSAEVNQSFADHEHETMLFAFTTHTMEVGRHTGAFSFKFVTHGAEHYRLGRRTVVLQPGQLLVTNAGQEYSSWIDGDTHAVSCFLSRSGFASIVACARAQPEALLDAPIGRDSSVDVLQLAFRPQRRLAHVLAGLDVLIRKPSPALDFLEERLLDAAGLAFLSALTIVPRNAGLRAVRRTTREELVTRVLTARDFIEDRAGRVTLGQMAHVAGLSPYHFLRVFKAVLGETPATYARRVRLRRGCTLLLRGASTHRAARAAGFSTGSSFLRSLRRTSPQPEGSRITTLALLGAGSQW